MSTASFPGYLDPNLKPLFDGKKPLLSNRKKRSAPKILRCVNMLRSHFLAPPLSILPEQPLSIPNSRPSYVALNFLKAFSRPAALLILKPHDSNGRKRPDAGIRRQAVVGPDGERPGG
jgi:hypothetical protein